MKKLLIIISLFIFITLLVVFIPGLNNEYIKNGKLYINEIMAKNDNTILDDYNEYSDYIELYNGYNYDINLKGYYLSDSEFDTRKWQFPDIEIKAKEYLIIFASSKDTCDLDKKICHTNFKLSSNSEILTLFDNNGNIISKVKYPALDMDKSYGYINGKYMIFDIPTPGKVNDNTRITKSNYNLKINEYMTHNTIHYDKYGNYFDWVEIYNDSNEEVNLTNVYISDDKNNLGKFKLPNVVIKPYDYLIVYFNNTSDKYEGVYTNFGLSDNDKNIVLFDGKDIIDIVDIVKLEDNISYGKTENGWKYFTTPTPGYINNTFSIGGNS